MAFWFKNCMRCNQGRLFIRKLDGSGQLYLHCEECEWSWANPSQLSIESGQLGIDFESEVASPNEITSMGWASFALHESAVEE